MSNKDKWFKVAPRKGDGGGNKFMSIFPAKSVMYVSPGKNADH